MKKYRIKDMDRKQEHLEIFLKKYDEHVLKVVPNLMSIPTPHEFKRQYVDLSRPFILRRPDPSLKDFALWKEDSYLLKKMPFKMVTVSRRPLEATKDFLILKEVESPQVPESTEPVYPESERNLSVPQAKERIFLPFNETISFRSFLNKLQCPPENNNGYIFIEKKNNLATEFSPLLPDVSSDVPWATEAFKKRPDAANIYIGNSDVTTPPHKNEFEMIYYAITGHKEFIIYPPVSTLWMPYMKYKKFQWESDFFNLRWKMIDLKEEVIGIEPKLKPTTHEKYLMMMHTKFFHIILQAGEGIYIPPQWIYETRQSDRHIGLDYWYDLCYSKTYEFSSLKNLLRNVYFPPKEST